MKRFLWFVAVVAIVGLAVVIAHRLAFPTWTLRYKVTVDVQTPEGVRTGSSVMQVSFGRDIIGYIFAGRNFPYQFLGEAVFVDLGQGHNVILTLTNDGTISSDAVAAFELPGMLYGIPWYRNTTRAELERVAMDTAIGRARNSGPAPVPFRILPLMVTAEDASDPQSIVVVDPENLRTTFGDGYALKSVTLSASNEPVSSTLPSRLPLYSKLSGQKRPQSGGVGTPRWLSKYDLVREE